MSIYWIKRNSKAFRSTKYLCHYVEGFSALWEEFLRTHSLNPSTVKPHGTGLGGFLSFYKDGLDPNIVREMVYDLVSCAKFVAWNVESFTKLLEEVYGITIQGNPKEIW